ncbi:hypothetical protein GCM10008090_27530 [Arenicella chitinivorans]|uniref:Lipoprotein n=1 Tax=Arenicella chitinivorans TaxID=1329800 RepID=A0A918VR55_9GAMM|nr:hypothetical protein [Arenicella chitinivorans]GHA16220.1 hypothetical protein GCM10008090_27530 [Arenicella chitinivorans]
MYKETITKTLRFSSTSLALLLILGCQSESAFSETHACDFTTPQTLATHYGVQAETVTETPNPRKSDHFTACEWQFVSPEGYPVALHVRTQHRTEKIKNPDFFKNNLGYLIDNGKKIGGRTVSFSATTLSDLPAGALSTSYGNFGSQSIAYTWNQGEERSITVTLTKSMTESGSKPNVDQEQLANAIKPFSF